MLKNSNIWVLHFLDLGHFVKPRNIYVNKPKSLCMVLLEKIRLFNLPISCQFDLFDKVVLSVLIYGCEVWGYEDLLVVERIHLKFLKHIFQLKSSTPSFMVMVNQVVSQFMLMCIVE